MECFGCTKPSPRNLPRRDLVLSSEISMSHPPTMDDMDVSVRHLKKKVVCLVYALFAHCIIPWPPRRESSFRRNGNRSLFQWQLVLKYLLTNNCVKLICAHIIEIRCRTCMISLLEGMTVQAENWTVHRALLKAGEHLQWVWNIVNVTDLCPTDIRRILGVSPLELSVHSFWWHLWVLSFSDVSSELFNFLNVCQHAFENCVNFISLPLAVHLTYGRHSMVVSFDTVAILWPWFWYL